MLFVQKIKEILKLGIASSFLKGERPVSILLLADAECGKTSILFSFDFRKMKFIVPVTKPTMSVVETLLRDMGENKVKYLVFPDLIRVTNSSQQTSKALIGTLNSAIEEGMTEITTFARGVPEIKRFNEPLYVGIATALTKAVMNDRRKAWRKIGFFSRMLPVSYSYSREQQKKIRQHIYEGKIFTQKEVMRLTEKKIECDAKYPAMFEDAIVRMALSENLYGFRYAKQLRTLLMASALLRGAKKVSQEDYDYVCTLMEYINTDYNEAK